MALSTAEANFGQEDYSHRAKLSTVLSLYRDTQCHDILDVGFYLVLCGHKAMEKHSDCSCISEQGQHGLRTI